MEKFTKQIRKQDAFMVFVILLSVFVFNLILLDLLILSTIFSGSNEGVLAAATKVVKAKSLLTPTPTQIPYCPTSCLTEIKQAVTSNSMRSSAAKDQFIFLGTGSVTSNTWANVPGAQATIDSAEYGSIKKVVFEVAVQNPYSAQRVYVRLYNSTGSYPIPNSTVLFDGQNSNLLTSEEISLPSGLQTYQVQMMVVQSVQSNLTLSRIHITTN